MDRYKQKQKEIYVDSSTFQQFAPYEERKEFTEFLKEVGASGDLEEWFDEFKGQKGFSQPLSMGLKGSNVSGIQDFSRVTTTLGSGTATGIESGSDLWKWGYDFVLEGGKGAPVKVPFGGKVVQVDTGHKPGEDNSFGNRVKIQMPDGREVWFSHLDSVASLREGQTIRPGTLIGTQGNTGSTIARNGGTGVHLDITMKKPEGGYFTSQEVASFFNTRLS